MLYKVFDFKCPQCGHILADQMFDEKNEPIPTCPECDEVMEKQIGTDWVPMVSWSQWNAAR